MRISSVKFLSAEMLGVYVAALAVVLSQLPPIYEMFARPKPDVSVGKFVTIDHQLGRETVLVSARIQNFGSAPLVIDSIGCKLEHVLTGEVHELSAEVFVDTSTLNPMVPGQFLEKEIGVLTLPPQLQPWNEQVRCMELPTSEQVEEQFQLVVDMRSYVDGRLRVEPGLRDRVVLPSRLSEKARAVFFENFDLSPGPHVFSLQLTSKGSVVAEYNTEEFELTTEHIETLLGHLDEYQFGGGVAFPLLNVAPVQVAIR